VTGVTHLTSNRSHHKRGRGMGQRVHWCQCQ